MIEQIENFLMDLDAMLSEHGITADVVVQFNVATKRYRIKPTGDLMTRQMTNNYCPRGNCGCKLVTDNKLNWCSGISCDYIGVKK